MASVTIKLVIDKDTGKKNVILDYESDADAMAMEHEDDHKRIVDSLIDGGALAAEELGTITITRDQPEQGQQAQEQGEEQVQRESLSEDS